MRETERIDAVVGIATCFGALLVAILLLAIAPSEPQSKPASEFEMSTP